MLYGWLCGMKPVIVIYWSRFALGIAAAFLSVAFEYFTGRIHAAFEINSFLNGLTLALLVYLLFYYAVKAKYALKVDKPSKLMTTGIGIYFFTWLVCWILFYSVIRGPPL